MKSKKIIIVILFSIIIFNSSTQKGQNNNVLETLLPTSSSLFEVSTDKETYYITEKIKAHFMLFSCGVETFYSFALTTKNESIENRDILFETELNPYPPAGYIYQNYSFEPDNYEIDIPDEGLDLFVALINRGQNPGVPFVVNSTKINLKKENLIYESNFNNTEIAYSETLNITFNCFSGRNNSIRAESEKIYYQYTFQDTIIQKNRSFTDNSGKFSIIFNSSCLSSLGNIVLWLKCNESFIFKQAMCYLNLNMTAMDVKLQLNANTKRNHIKKPGQRYLPYNLAVDVLSLNDSIFWNKKMEYVVEYQNELFSLEDQQNGTYWTNINTDTFESRHEFLIYSNNSYFSTETLNFTLRLLKRNCSIEILNVQQVNKSMLEIHFDIFDLNEGFDIAVISQSIGFLYKNNSNVFCHLNGFLSYNGTYQYRFFFNDSYLYNNDIIIQILYTGNETYNFFQDIYVFNSNDYISGKSPKIKPSTAVLIITCFALLGTSLCGFLYKKYKTEYKISELKVKF